MFFFGLLTVLSCKKDGPTEALITVVDSVSHPVTGAKVTLWQDTAINPYTGVQSRVRVTKLTDVSGQALFSFQLEAFLNVEVIKNVDTAKSFVRLKEHEKVDKTVIL